ncbi:rossmann fold nucleotide-binding protein smf [hydrocarbon metagenome]|uniref:Rossmann fold nucleotide-binding protein smf n=1 Tax=hydrocarbon metagenome TaxID=938273 RepID=A0A0W8FLB6_9ZZZZ
MNDSILKYWIALKSITGVGNITFLALIDKFGSLPAIFSAPISKLIEIQGLSQNTAAAIAGFKSWDKVKAELELLDKNKINIITCHDELYPPRLMNIYDRPPLMYVRGDLNRDDINIAIVGSRMASSYGKYTTERISRELALKGLTIVSGMARGIDSTAHRGAIAAHGRTIAILGSGLDIIYPPENKKLFDDIIQNGAVISEFPLGTPPRSANFPTRNRIISGMCCGVVIVEAGEKSGSLITAKLALEQGREVFAVPGSIDSAGSRGTNKLIKQGAILIESVDDILEEIIPQIEITIPLKSPHVSCSEKVNQECHEILTGFDQKIFDSISKGRIHIDDIISTTGLPSAGILSVLTNMELRGIVEQHPGKFFSLKK